MPVLHVAVPAFCMLMAGLLEEVFHFIHFQVGIVSSKRFVAVELGFQGITETAIRSKSRLQVVQGQLLQRALGIYTEVVHRLRAGYLFALYQLVDAVQREAGAVQEGVPVFAYEADAGGCGSALHREGR